MTDMIAVAYPDELAVVALVADGTLDKALSRMARFGGEVMHTSLSFDDELQLSRALGAKQGSTHE